MSLPAIFLYRTARVAVRRPNGSLLTTEGEQQQVLYVNHNGTIGGTGSVAIHLMYPEMISIRAEIIRYSGHPVCNYVWRLKTDHFKLRVKFTSPWQPFAQLVWIPSPEEHRVIATASFSRSPGEVAVRMGPSGRAVGTATQTPVAGHGSPMIYSIDIGIVEDDSLVIFQPDDSTLAPVFSQTLTRPPFGLSIETVQPNLYSTKDPFRTSDQHDTVYVTESERHTGVYFPHWTNDASPSHPETSRQSCGSNQSLSPHANNSSPASGSTLSICSRNQSGEHFDTVDTAGTQHDAIDDRCIVVKLLP
ncbi:hypothetical protein BDP55DRAFT_721194 [Colletotrichum godetiae]|uniref:Uncharacterized protein n=1 Tax=Colletotrichum godetiae TaxID=1209918 RepID=A0AAJ0A815_9PEZI|nr:uncharacterized protein BDP55DRAFT_721194 [Colletotrichum godetiae]KAK1657749.1 hypothetical protein BDP55DRAFT_721194 [Colletotrichum godetiae]